MEENKITYDMIAIPNAYGFGKDWTIIIKKDGKLAKSFWLGQDVKVVSRILGMRMNEAIEHYKNKYGSENFDVVKDYIAADILRKVLDTQRLTQDQLEKLLNRNNWELAVE